MARLKRRGISSARSERGESTRALQGESVPPAVEAAATVAAAVAAARLMESASRQERDEVGGVEVPL